MRVAIEGLPGTRRRFKENTVLWYRPNGLAWAYIKLYITHSGLPAVPFRWCGHAYGVGSVQYRSCTAYHNGRLGCRLCRSWSVCRTCVRVSSLHGAKILGDPSEVSPSRSLTIYDRPRCNLRKEIKSGLVTLLSEPRPPNASYARWRQADITNVLLRVFPSTAVW